MREGTLEIRIEGQKGRYIASLGEKLANGSTPEEALYEVLTVYGAIEVVALYVVNISFSSQIISALSEGTVTVAELDDADRKVGLPPPSDYTLDGRSPKIVVGQTDDLGVYAASVRGYSDRGYSRDAAGAVFNLLTEWADFETRGPDGKPFMRVRHGGLVDLVKITLTSSHAL